MNTSSEDEHEQADRQQQSSKSLQQQNTDVSRDPRNLYL